MKNLQVITLLILAFPLLLACGDGKRERLNETEVMDGDNHAEEKKPLVFYNYEEVNAFPDAIIEMYHPLGNETYTVGKVPFEFNIRNYPFGEGLQGFRLKMIINGNSPIGYNQPIFQQEFKEGSHRVVAYLVDDKGLSLKEFGNYVDRDFMVGNSRPVPDPDEPYMVLNLPEQDQEYDLHEELIIDYLLIGGDLKSDKLKFLIEINGYSYESRQLMPVRVDSLSPGEYDLKVQLLNEDGSGLSGIFSTARRKFVVKE